METEIKFICPVCGGTELLMEKSVDVNITSSRRKDRISMQYLSEQQRRRFKCTNCNYMLMDQDGQFVKNGNDLGDWIKNHCNKE
jgi:transposase-like protein